MVPLAKLGEGENVKKFLIRFERYANLLKLTGEWKAYLCQIAYQENLGVFMIY